DFWHRGWCDFAVAVSLLLCEADPRPRVDERTARGEEHVVAITPLLDPACCRVAVEVARVLGLLHGVARELDPDVLAPDVHFARCAAHIADEAAASQSGRAGCVSRAPRGLELLERSGRVLVALRQQRLGLAMARVPRREEACGLVEMLVGEGDDLHA